MKCSLIVVLTSESVAVLSENFRKSIRGTSMFTSLTNDFLYFPVNKKNKKIFFGVLIILVYSAICLQLIKSNLNNFSSEKERSIEVCRFLNIPVR